MLLLLVSRPLLKTCLYNSVADPNILKGGGAEDNLSAPSSFISNAHNEIYAFYTEKKFFLTKM